MIAVNTEKLARLLGLESWPEDVPLDSDLKCMAARAVSDFMSDHANTPHQALNNAFWWVRHAYREGETMGIQMERRRWEKKIAEMFGIGPSA